MLSAAADTLGVGGTSTITTAAGKLNDDAFIFTSGHEQAGLAGPILNAQRCVINSLRAVNMGVQ